MTAGMAPPAPTEHRADALVVGAGPAGLDAAATLAREGVGNVVVLERESEAGGIPRHAVHQGFGLRDLRRPFSGPRYAEAKLGRALERGVKVLTERQVTGWDGDGLLVTGPDGRSRWSADAILLTTGCRERPRPARHVPGSRVPGVLTTGMLQQLVYLNGHRLGGRAVIVGAELVSFSSLITLHHGGVRPVAMVTDLDRHQVLAPLGAAAALRYRVPIRTRTAVVAIHGGERVEAVELRRGDSSPERVECEHVVFTADWISDGELARSGGIELGAGMTPAVDAGLRSSRVGVFAAGNVLQEAEPADVAALSGRHAAAAIAAHLGGEPWPSSRVAVTVAPPLAWVSPNRVSGTGPPPRGRFTVRAQIQVSGARLLVEQDGRRLWSGRRRFLGPGRSTALPWRWVEAVDPGGGDVRISLA